MVAPQNEHSPATSGGVKVTVAPHCVQVTSTALMARLPICAVPACRYFSYERSSTVPALTGIGACRPQYGQERQLCAGSKTISAPQPGQGKRSCLRFTFVISGSAIVIATSKESGAHSDQEKRIADFDGARNATAPPRLV